MTVGNAAEHLTAVWMAMKGKMEITLGVAIGSSIQIAVGVVPILVLVSWALRREFTLYFENFETICFFIAILLVNIVVGEFLIYMPPENLNTVSAGCLIPRAMLLAAVISNDEMTAASCITLGISQPPPGNQFVQNMYSHVNDSVLILVLTILSLGDGLSNYYGGMMLVALYIVMAVAFWVYRCTSQRLP